MFRLTNWYIAKATDYNDGSIYYYAKGRAYDNPKFREGRHIHSSVIQNIKVEDKSFVICTMNSEYKVLFKDYKLSHKADLMNLKVFHLERYYKEIISLARKESSREYCEMFKLVEPKQFYLIVSGVSPKTSYFKDDNGKLYRINPSIHDGMFQDSILYNENGIVDVRYFPHFSSIEFYHISNSVKSIIIKNTGHDITYSEPFNQEEKLLRQDEELYLVEDDFREIEGLISPDCVDGKSMILNLFKSKESDDSEPQSEEEPNINDDDIDYDEEGGDEDIFANFKDFEKDNFAPEYDYIKARIFNSLLLKHLEKGKIDRETYNKACKSAFMDSSNLNYIKWLRD